MHLDIVLSEWAVDIIGYIIIMYDYLCSVCVLFAPYSLFSVYRFVNYHLLLYLYNSPFLLFDFRRITD